MREQILDPFRGPLWRVSIKPTAPPLGLPGKQVIEWNGALRWLKSGMPANAVREAARRAKGHATLFRAADKQVVALAKQEKIDLAAATPAVAGTMAMVPAGAAFDVKFAQIMVEDHAKDIAEAIEARDSTTDGKLKVLLNELIPTLQKHQEAAQKIASGAMK